MRTFDEIPPGITPDLIRQSVVEYDIHQTPHPYKESTDYDVIIDDRPYPPVAILGIASALVAGSEECPNLKGGMGTPCFQEWERMDFPIVPKDSHSREKRRPKDSLSWSEYLDCLKGAYGFDPRELLSVCLRIQPTRSLKRFLGRDEIGPVSILGPKKDHFSIGRRDWFRTIEVAFTPNRLKLYLVSPGLDRFDHLSQRSKMDQRFNDKYFGALNWPTTGPSEDGIQMLDANNACASYPTVNTESQCSSVVSWLREESNLQPRKFRHRESRSAKLRRESPELFEPTSDENELQERENHFIDFGLDEEPIGNANPRRIKSSEYKGHFARDGEVRAWVKQRADGVCEKCDQPAPFHNKFGKPFLEVHHIVPLSEGGEDIVANAVALCPNCHRECHYGQDVEGIRELPFSKLSHQ